MPSFVTAGEVDTGALRAVVVGCDGRDGRRVEPERVERDRVWVLLWGGFRWRDRRRRAVVDPSVALLLRDGEEFEIRHPEGGAGDVCLSLSGDAVRAVVAAAPAGPRPLRLGAFVRLAGLARALRRGGAVDPLAVEEALVCGVARDDGGAAVGPRGREVAAAIAHALQLGVVTGAPPSLAEIAAAAGVSPFHACRTFRAVTGTSIHQQRLRLRARHAVATLLERDWPLARVAAECGYASQAHMTTQLVRLVGVTPRQVRTVEGRRRLLRL